MPFKPDRLLVQLQNTGLANKDNPQYQLISQIIKALGSLQLDINNISGGGGGGGTIVNEFITQIGGLQGDPGIDGFDGPPGQRGIDGATGALGPMGVTLLGEDGVDGFDGFNIPNPGPAGSTGAQGPMGVSFPAFDGDDGETYYLGIPGATGAAGTTSIKTVTVRLSDAQLKSLNSSPVTVISAAGANIIIFPIAVCLFKSFTGGTYSGTFAISLRYTGIADNITGSVTLANTAVLQTARVLGDTGTVLDNNDTRNLAVTIRSGADRTGGNAANFLEVTIVYQEFDTSVT